MAKTTVHVTSEDLEKPYGSNYDCPIACALKRTFPDTANQIIVGGYCFYLGSECYNFETISPCLQAASNDLIDQTIARRPLWFRFQVRQQGQD